jgi:hypothetical protein
LDEHLGLERRFIPSPRVLRGFSPDETVRRRLEAYPGLANARYEPFSDPCIVPKTLLIGEAAKKVSHPDR